MQNETKVFLVHQSRLFIEVLSAQLGRFPEITLVGAVRDVGQLFESLSAISPDVVLVDARMARVSPHELIREMVERFGDVKIVAFGLDHQQDVLEFIESGASTYIPLGASIGELVDVIRAVHKDQILCSPEVLQSVIVRLHELYGETGDPVREKNPRQIRLTPREQQVLEWMARGLRNKEIARRLGITLPTVKNHVHKILDKLQVHRRREAIREAYECGLLKEAPPLQIRSEA